MHVEGPRLEPTPPTRVGPDTTSRLSVITSVAREALSHSSTGTEISPPVEVIRTLRETSLDLDALFREAIAIPLPFEDARPANKLDPPILLLIARLRQNLGTDWEPKFLGNIPLDRTEILTLFEGTGGLTEDLYITPNDLKIYVAVVSKYYYLIDEKGLKSSFFAQLNTYESLKYETYSPSLLDHFKNLSGFCGIKGVFRGENLEGHFFEISHNEMTKTIESLSSITSTDHIECKEAFEAASKCDIFYDKTIRKIKEGKFVIIPLGFSTPMRGHTVDLVFYRDEFIICNRGARILKEASSIERYRYRKEFLNEDVIRYLFLNFFTKISESTALEHQHLYLYTILPKILNGVKKKSSFTTTHGGLTVTFHEKPSDFAVKDQSIGNCWKASPFTAFKLFIFLKRQEEGFPEKEAARLAKFAGNELSILMRAEMISRVEGIFPELTTEEQVQVSPLLAEATSKLERKKAALAYQESLNLILPKAESLIEFVATALDTPSTLRASRATIDSHHPLLLLIAKERKTMAHKWDPIFLLTMPIDPKRALALFLELGGIEGGLLIQPEDFKIFGAITKEVEKHPDLLERMGF